MRLPRPRLSRVNFFSINMNAAGGLSYHWDPDSGFDKRLLVAAILVYLLISWLPVTLPLAGGFASGASSGIDAAGLSNVLLSRSLSLSFWSASLALFMGLPLGVSLWNRGGIIFRWRWLFFIFLLLPPFLLVQGWLAIAAWTASMAPPTGFWWAVLILGTAYTPVTALIVAMARSSIDGAALQSSALVGGAPGMMRLVVYPQLQPFLCAAWLLVGIIVILEGGVPLSLQFSVLATELTSRFMSGATPGQLVLKLWPLYLLVGCMGLAVYRLLMSGKSRSDTDSESELLQLQYFSPWLQAYFKLGVSMFLLLGAIPLAGIVRQALYGAGSGMAFSSDRSAMFSSLWLGALVAVLAAAIALPVGAWLAKGCWSQLKILCLLPLSLPAGLTGIAWAYYGVQLNRLLPWLPESLPMVLGHLARVLPIAVLVAVVVWKSRAGILAREAVLLQRRHFWQKLWLDLPRLLLLAIIAGVFSLRELEVALLTVPPGGETLPLRVFNLLHYGAGADVCRLSIFMALPILVGAWFIFRRWCR